MTITRPSNSARSSARSIVNFVAAIAIGSGALAPAPTVHADVYRWVGDDGTVNYGEREPRGREFTVISRNGTETKGSTKAASSSKSSAPNSSAPATAQAPQSGADSDSNQNLSPKQQAMLDRMKADEAKRQENLAEIRKSNCDSSKRVLSQMQAKGRIRVRNDNGEESAMSDQVRNEKIREAQESIALNCKSLS